MSTPACLNHLTTHLNKKPKRYVPYRDSKLTWLLRDSLGGNSKTAVIVTVSPSELCLHETIHSLRFAQRIKMIKTHPINNKESNRKYIDRLLEEISRLRGQMIECNKRHSADNLNHRQKSKNQKQLRRGKQPEEIKQSELLPKVCHRPTIQNRNCQSETFNSLDLETTSYSSKHTLTQGCQTLQFAYETINSENTSSSLNSEVYHLDDSLDFSSRSLPNFIRSHSTSQLCLPKWKSAMDWLEFREFPERIPSSEMSTHLISTDSLDNLLSSSVMQADKNLRRFDYTSRNELFVPEFIPLPNIKSPVQIIRKEFEKLSGEERNLAKSASLADLLNGVSYLHGRKWSSYYHINPTTEEQLKQRDEFFVANSDGEQDVLTIVTSLGSSASTFVEKEDEIIIPM
ncbi:unnamed protein product [Hymenolepis diminuta]|uniref:Kinesin motor domain-containing protein n=1 Tax=Hymenolepis diminuta TaxID=6216 RepID=A0A564XWZ6_HYMDI|nr:unnamed protein product [Hymenolepis diminuta]